MIPPPRAAALAHYGDLSRVARALASPIRLRLLDLLRQAPRTVDALAQAAGVPVANASQHLQILRRPRLVSAERRGAFVQYRVSTEAVSRLFASIRTLAEALLPELDRARDVLGALSPEERERLLARIRSGAVTLLDVRPAEEYLAGHLPRARSIPLADLPDRVEELPRSREVVAYCRGPYCSLAVEAVALLRSSGYRARHLDLGIPELRARRFRISTGDGAGPAPAGARRRRRPPSRDRRTAQPRSTSRSPKP